MMDTDRHTRELPIARWLAVSACCLFAGVTLVLAACTTIRISTNAPRVGGRMPCVADAASSVMTAAGRQEAGCLAMVDGTFFAVASSDRSHVSYVGTTSARFRTPEGIGIGATLKSVRAKRGAAVTAERGWAYFSRLPSGWCARFPGVPGQDPPPGEDAPVVEIFIRR